jgi:hypothetical protein
MAIFQIDDDCLSEATSFEEDCSQGVACLQDNGYLTDHAQDDGYIADDESGSHVASHPWPSLDLRRPAEVLPLHQPKPKLGVIFLLPDRMSSDVPIKSPTEGSSDTDEACLECFQFKNTLKMRVIQENQRAPSLGVSDRKKGVLSEEDASTSVKVHTAWQAHIIKEHVGEQITSNAK